MLSSISFGCPAAGAAALALVFAAGARSFKVSSFDSRRGEEQEVEGEVLEPRGRGAKLGAPVPNRDVAGVGVGVGVG